MLRRTRWSPVLAVSLLVAIVVIGGWIVAPGPSTVLAPDTAPAAHTHYVAIVPPGMTSPFHVSVAEGARAEGAKLGWIAPTFLDPMTVSPMPDTPQILLCKRLSRSACFASHGAEINCLIQGPFLPVQKRTAAYFALVLHLTAHLLHPQDCDLMLPLQQVAQKTVLF